MSCSLLFGIVFVLFAGATGYSQTTFQYAVKVGETQGNVRFVVELDYKGGELNPDGSILFKQPGEIQFTFREFVVSNEFSPAQRDSLVVVP